MIKHYACYVWAILLEDAYGDKLPKDYDRVMFTKYLRTIPSHVLITYLDYDMRINIFSYKPTTEQLITAPLKKKFWKQ